MLFDNLGRFELFEGPFRKLNPFSHLYYKFSQNGAIQFTDALSFLYQFIYFFYSDLSSDTIDNWRKKWPDKYWAPVQSRFQAIFSLFGTIYPLHSLETHNIGILAKIKQERFHNWHSKKERELNHFALIL